MVEVESTEYVCTFVKMVDKYGCLRESVAMRAATLRELLQHVAKRFKFQLVKPQVRNQGQVEVGDGEQVWTLNVSKVTTAWVTANDLGK